VKGVSRHFEAVLSGTSHACRKQALFPADRGGASRGDAGKARVALRWRATVDSAGLVRMMVDHDMDLARRERLPLYAGMEPEPRLSHVG